MIKQIFDIVNVDYGCRGIYISELAHMLSISYRQANALTLAAGYHRGRKICDITLSEFEKDITVQYISKHCSVKTQS